MAAHTTCRKPLRCSSITSCAGLSTRRYGISTCAPHREGNPTLALSALPAGSLAVCNEVVRNRTHILAENIIKWGYDNTVVTRNTAADFGKLHHYFDVVLVDAPCSGEGMFRKDAKP